MLKKAAFLSSLAAAGASEEGPNRTDLVGFEVEAPPCPDVASWTSPPCFDFPLACASWAFARLCFTAVLFIFRNSFLLRLPVRNDAAELSAPVEPPGAAARPRFRPPILPDMSGKRWKCGGELAPGQLPGAVAVFHLPLSLLVQDLSGWTLAGDGRSVKLDFSVFLPCRSASWSFGVSLSSSHFLAAAQARQQVQATMAGMRISELAPALSGLQSSRQCGSDGMERWQGWERGHRRGLAHFAGAVWTTPSPSQRAQSRSDATWL